jgi:gluconokinase
MQDRLTGHGDGHRLCIRKIPQSAVHGLHSNGRAAKLAVCNRPSRFEILKSKSTMSNVPGLRSTYAKTGRLVYFGRMLDKIRLKAAGKLPADYLPNIARGFDARCCDFLHIKHADLADRVLQGGTDEEVLAWCHEKGGPRTDEECEVWNGFLSKRGWRDGGSDTLQIRIKEFGFEGKPIETFFDLIEYDEGRDPAATKPWR